MKTAIYALYQRHEFDKMRCFIAQALPCLGPNRTLHILINDDDCPELRRHAGELSPHIVVHWAGGNLGVAGGRNHLIRKTLAEGADFFVSCDTDIIYERSYFQDIETAYRKLQRKDPDLGFVQPVLLDGRTIRKTIPALADARNWHDVFMLLGKPESRIQRMFSRWLSWRSGFWKPVLAQQGADAAVEMVYHTGVSDLWHAHFGAPFSASSTRLSPSPDGSQSRTEGPTLRSSPGILQKLIKRGSPVRIGSTAGGVCAYDKRAIERAGEYCELFNPFGYEDSEMGFRSTLSGQHNYLITDLFAIHDIFLGEVNRPLLSYSRLGLLRGVELAHPKLFKDEFSFGLAQSILFSWTTLFRLFTDEIESGRIAASDAARHFPSFAISYGLDLVRGLLHGLGSNSARKPDESVLGLLAGFIGEDSRIDNFRMPLGHGAVLACGSATARQRPADHGRIFSFFASNCRIENHAKQGSFASRYFDVSCVVEPCPDKSPTHLISIDVQSNEKTFRLKLVVERRAQPQRDGSLRILRSEIDSKSYDFGAFSVEDIYPSPTLHQAEKWLEVIDSFLGRNSAAIDQLGLAGLCDSIRRYLSLPAATEQATAPLSANGPGRKKRILLFADSRGQHKPAGSEHLVFGERLAADPRLAVDLFLCPMKWTTTLDFLEQFGSEKLASYDHVILYTGIVDWSPRRVGSALSDLYDNPKTENADNIALNTRDYSKKIINNKKIFFDLMFGSQAMADHFNAPLDTLYEGEKTANMYSLEMAREHLIPRLLEIPNLIFINSNRLVDGWNGDYRRQRPINMPMTHAYADLFADMMPKDRMVDLRCWSADEVKLHTCDNLHLTESGNEFVHSRLMEIIGLSPLGQNKAKSPVPRPQTVQPASQPPGSAVPVKLSTPTRIGPEQKQKLLAQAGNRKHLATLIIGVRLPELEDVRVKNLKIMLDWIDHYYGDLFDVLLVEQDRCPRVSVRNLGGKSYVRTEFIYNPREYNRGWGYNVAVKHFCADAVVVALMDTDVLTSANFVQEIIDCHTKYEAISPYQNIYYTVPKEVGEIEKTKRLDTLRNPKCIKNPVTVSGGILIVRRNTLLSLNGFEQYVGYGCEDRALDVTLYNHIDPARIRIAKETYAHLHHPSDQIGRARLPEILAHLTNNYGCMYDPSLGPYDFIHANCSHSSRQVTQKLMEQRADSFGDARLYQTDAGLSINGQQQGQDANVAAAANVIFPPDFASLDDYAKKEIYENTSEPDSAELAKLYNAFKGKRCFIIGNGPSLNKHDLSLLENEYTFGVNSFYYKTRETGFRPFFYVVEDSSVMKENIEEIRKYEAPFKFFPTNYRSLHPKQPNTIFFKMNRGFYEKSSPNFVVPRFSTDASKVLYCGQSVTYINLQLAYFMGFTEVYLIGMDFSYVIPETHKRTGDVLLSDTDDPNHFHQDYFGKGKTWKDPKLDRVAMNYRMAKLVYESTGRRIFNATIGGNLEIFDRADYNVLLRKRIAYADLSFAAANALYRKGQYADALSAYIALMKKPGNTPRFLYEQGARLALARIGSLGLAYNPEDAQFARELSADA